jgi:methionyl-tRNA formyltransferase
MLKIIYAGTPEFAVPALSALLQSDHQVVAVYTQPDRPAGRGRKLQPGPVKRCALDAGVPVCQPQRFADAGEIEHLRNLDADLMVVAAYGLLLPRAVLDVPRLGCINIHASLLPRWRGASPIQHAILSGDAQSGITLMQMDEGLDTGAMIAQRNLAIDPDWTAGDLHDALAPLGAELLIEVLDDAEFALRRAVEQDEREACYAPRLTKQQAEIDWRAPVAELHRQVLAYNPWPVSFTTLDGDNLRIWYARPAAGREPGEPGRVLTHERDGIYVSCGDGVLQVTELQFAGRKRCSAADALNARDLNGTVLGRD